MNAKGRALRPAFLFGATGEGLWARFSRLIDRKNSPAGRDSRAAQLRNIRKHHGQEQSRPV
jgi:hypothetical protein